MIQRVSGQTRDLHVGHLFSEFCPRESTLRYWPVVNPYVRSSVYCQRRTNAQLFPHDRLHVESLATSLRTMHGLPGRRLLAGMAHRMSWDRYLKTEQPDVIHVQYGTKAVRFLPMLARTRCPVVATFRGSDINCATYKAKYMVELSALFERAAYCHFVSEDLRDKGIRLGCPPAKAKALHVGASSTDQCTQYSQRTDECRFYCIASLLPCKGHETLFRAFTILKDRVPQAQLHLVGSGPLEDRLRWLSSELDLSNDIVFHGQLPHADVQTLVASEADVVVLASQRDDGGHEEGLPTCLQEASALGIACIGTRCGGIAELVLDRSTGLVVEQRDTNGLAEAMIELATSPHLREQYGQVARQRAAKHFNLDNFYRNIRDVYRQAAELVSA